MSGGEQQMLTVARTLMGNPLLVLLDEPSEGVAPLIVEQMADTIVELKKEGLSILLSEQNIHFARLVSDRVYVLEKGQIRWQGAMAQLDRQSGRAAGLFDGLRPSHGEIRFVLREGLSPARDTGHDSTGALRIAGASKTDRQCGVKN